MLTFDHDKLSTGIQPLTVTISEAVRLSGLSRSELYRQLSAGRILASKSGARTLIVWASLRIHVETLPRAEFRAPKAVRNETAPGADAPVRGGRPDIDPNLGPQICGDLQGRARIPAPRAAALKRQVSPARAERASNCSSEGDPESRAQSARNMMEISQ
jgi:hypothetical protein